MAVRKRSATLQLVTRRRPAALAAGLVEEDRGRDADVQGTDLPRERNRDHGVARAADEWTYSFSLGAEDERGSSREVGVPHRQRAFGVRGVRPQVVALD